MQSPLQQQNKYKCRKMNYFNNINCIFVRHKILQVGNELIRRSDYPTFHLAACARTCFTSVLGVWLPVQTSFPSTQLWLWCSLFSTFSLQVIRTTHVWGTTSTPGPSWPAGLTVVGHAHRQALLEAAVLALVAILLLDLAATLTLVILQLQTDGPTEKTLKGCREKNQKKKHVTK